MAMRRIFPQPDLFATPPPRMMLTPAQRTKLVDLWRDDYDERCASITMSAWDPGMLG